MRRESRGLPRVLIADGNEANVSWLQAALGGECEIYKVQAAARIGAALQGLSPHVLIIGHKLHDIRGPALLEQLAAGGMLEGLATMFMVGRGESAPDDEALYYVLTTEMSPGDVQAIIASAVVRRLDNDREVSAEEAARLSRLLEVPRRFAAQRDLRGAGQVAISALAEFLQAERADCLFYDHDEGSLWSEGEGEQKWQGGRESSARLGLAGFSARTGQALAVERASKDPRYHRETDDPDGRGDERILVQPIEGSDGEIHAVLVGVRGGRREPFTAEEQRLIGWLAKQLGPLTGQLAMSLEAETILEEAAEAESQIFRREAALARATAGKRGDVVRVSPAWVSWSYWLLLLVFIAGGAYSFIGQISEYSAGAAVVYQTGRTDISSPVNGNVVAVHVEPEQTVEAGQVLATFYSPDESSQLAQLDQEWETSLRAYLANPVDKQARGAVATLRAQRDRIASKLTVRADHAGVIAGIRVTEGQSVLAGQALMTVGREGGELLVIALMPGSDRPQLAAGMPLRFEVLGYRDGGQTLEIESVGTEVIGPTEAQLLLGRQIADSVPLGGPVVVVRAKLPERTFESDGERYELTHGLQGRAEVRLRSASIIETLIPGLKR